jgi:hypothetical protein
MKVGQVGQVGTGVRSPMTAEVDVTGVAARRKPAGVDLGAQNSV